MSLATCDVNKATRKQKCSPPPKEKKTCNKILLQKFCRIFCNTVYCELTSLHSTIVFLALYKFQKVKIANTQFSGG